jgi:hypothetical protein
MGRTRRIGTWQHATAAKTLKEEAHFILISARAAEERGEAERAHQLFAKAHTYMLHAARRDKEAGVKISPAWERALRWDARAQAAAKRGDKAEAGRCLDEALQCAARGFKG